MQEEWKPVKGFEKYYEVNKEGVVRTKGRLIKRKSTLGKPHTVPVKPKIKKPYQTKAGYITVALVIKNKTKNTYLHRIIAEAFIPEIDKEKNVVNHKNGIKNDNRICNLEWVTSSENNIHALDKKLRRPRRYMNKQLIIKILNLRDEGFINAEIAKKLNLTKNIVQGVTSGRTYKRLLSEI